LRCAIWRETEALHGAVEGGVEFVEGDSKHGASVKGLIWFE
jgi:hypothetical protein